MICLPRCSNNRINASAKGFKSPARSLPLLWPHWHLVGVSVCGTFAAAAVHAVVAVVSIWLIATNLFRIVAYAFAFDCADLFQRYYLTAWLQPRMLSMASLQVYEYVCIHSSFSWLFEQIKENFWKIEDLN